MKTNAWRIVALLMISGACFIGVVNWRTANSMEVDEAAVSNHEAEQRAAAAARAKDPAWKPSASEVGLIQIGDGGKPGALRNFCLNAEGNILACFAPVETNKPAKKESGIRVYSPKGELLKTMPLEIDPTAICVAKDGSIFVAGDGRLLKLDGTGKVLASAVSPVANDQVTIGQDVEDMVKEMIKQSKTSYDDEIAKMKTMLEKRRSTVTGLAATGDDVFMVVPAPSDFTYRVYRFNQALEAPNLVVEKLRGCCSQMDLQAHDGNLWIPHNARHAVESRDRDGKELSKFGKAGRVKPGDFGGCCEPKNMRVLPDGDILVAESGPPTCIKRFSTSGKFKEVIAVVEGSKGDCVRVTVEMSPDKSRYYMLDTTRDAIRIFKAKS
jgi:hypothetical protein